MSWADYSKRKIASVALTMATGFSVAIMPAHAGIVVAASGPSAKSYPPGTKLDDAAKISLKAQDSITVLTAKGTRELKGSGTFTIGAPAGVNRAVTFAALTAQRSATRVRTGAVRSGGGEGPVLRPNLWYVDVTSGGPICILDPGEVRAWRPVTAGEAVYSVSRRGGAASSLKFADGAMVSVWNGVAAPAGDGATYRIASAKGTPAISVTFAVLPRADYGPEDLAAALLAKGCAAQLEVLAQSTLLLAG